MKCDKCYSRVGYKYDVDDHSLWLCINCASDLNKLIEDWLNT